MRVVFVGNVEFSGVMLRELMNLHLDIVGVVTKKLSTFNSDHYDISLLLSQTEIPFKYVNDINHENNVAWIKALKPDIIFCFGWSSLLKASVLEIPPLGVLGYHPALLPHNRGRHPIIWALALGLKRTGSTFFFMSETADAGDILSQKEVEIEEADDARLLYNKLVNVAIEQMKKFVPQLQSGVYSRMSQNLSKGNSWRKRSADDGKIDWRMSNQTIFNLVRALAKPYPGAHITYNGSNVRIERVVKVDYPKDNIEPGKVLQVKERQVFVKAGEGAICIQEHAFDILPKEGDYLL